MGGCPLPLPHPFSSLFLTSKIIFLQKQRLSNWCSLLWMVLTLVLVTHLPVPVGFSSGRFFVYFKAEILILRRSFSLWGESVSLSELDSKRYALNINPQGRSTLAPLPFCYSNIRTTTTTTIELTSTTSNLTKYLTKEKFLRRISEKNSRFFRKFLLKNENQWFLISLKIADFRRRIDILGVSRKNVLFCIEYHFFNDSFFETKIT